jgi:hypothetical protein
MTKFLRLGAVSLMLAAAGIVASAAPAAADSGGGCKLTVRANVCISVHSGTTNPLYFDYYVTPYNEWGGDASVEWLCGGSYAYDYLGWWAPVNGHSPVYSRTKQAGCNSARTFVHIYASGYNYLYTAYSPWQYW